LQISGGTALNEAKGGTKKKTLATALIFIPHWKGEVNSKF
jgi:hypothetical protein